MILVTFQTYVGPDSDLKLAGFKLFKDKEEFQQLCLEFFNDTLQTQYTSYSQLYNSDKEFMLSYTSNEDEFYETVADFLDNFEIHEIANKEIPMILKYFKRDEFGYFPF